MAKRTYDDDDGRTIADMSDVYVRTPLGYRRLGDKRRRETEQPEKTVKNDPSSGTSREERRSYIWGALSASLLIALAFIVGLGLIILLMVLVFK